jgi:hypothetical protein|eukprot:7391702-Prymnesium_polylepis.2
MSDCIAIRPSHCLKGVVKREYHTRKKGCYVLEDKHGQYLIVAQKLPKLVAFLNTIATDTASKVSLTALYQIQDKSDNKVGGFSKYRWRLHFAPFEDACSLFESERGRFEQTLVLGQPECYRIEQM